MDLAQRLVELLLEGNRRVNLTRVTSADDIARLHLLDSLAALPEIDRLAPAHAIDLGSGCGLPALPLAMARPGIGWALHHHSRWGTVWSDMKRVPPIHDQTGAGGGGQLVLVDEYDGGVSNVDAAAKAVALMGDAELALLAHHGVFVLGGNVNAVYWRAASLEWRCRNAWLVEQGGGGPGVPQIVHDTFGRSDGTRFVGYWETAVRRELRRDPALAATVGVEVAGT